MIKIFKKHWEVISYLIFGVLTTLLNILLYALFNRLFGYTAANSWGNVLDNILCILFAYATNRAFVFNSKTRGRAMAKEFGAFVTCRLGTMLLDTAIMLVLGNLLAAQGAALMDELMQGVLSVVGFPLGAMDTASKAFEAKTAIENGAAEVDMVINIGRLKNKEYDAVREDIRAVKEAVGDKVLKVIIETCLLTDEEKEKMCDIVCEAGADYIKTSTGFSTAGATFHDVELMVKGVHGRCKVKAAGGISTVEDMEKFLALGADRLGTSRAVKLLNGEQAKGY